MSRLRRLRPGRPGIVSAVQLQDGRVSTNPEDMAQVLRAHWSDVFGARRCDTALLSTWLAEELPAPPPGEPHRDMPPVTDPRWQLRRSDVEEALRQAPSSAPGPDGLPYSAWQALGALGVDVLWAVAGTLAAGGMGAAAWLFGEA